MQLMAETLMGKCLHDWSFVGELAEALWIVSEQGPPKRCGDLGGAC